LRQAGDNSEVGYAMNALVQACNYLEACSCPGKVQSSTGAEWDAAKANVIVGVTARCFNCGNVFCDDIRAAALDLVKDWVADPPQRRAVKGEDADDGTIHQG